MQRLPNYVLQRLNIPTRKTGDDKSGKQLKESVASQAPPIQLTQHLKAKIYPLTSSPETATARFVSQGPRGEIPKIIQFELLSADEQAPVYNLAFGDGTEVIDDLAVSDNGDADKVLATVAAAAERFLTDHPKALLYATGSTPARTRLYRIGLVRSLPFVRTKFLLFGLVNGEPEPFEPGRPYQAFIAQLISA